MWSQKIQIQIIISKNLKLKRKRISDRQWQTGRPSGLTRRTVRGSPTDCPRGSQRRGELLDTLVVISDHPHRGAGPSARLANCLQVRCGLSARATRRRGQGRRLLLKPDHSLIYLCRMDLPGPTTSVGTRTDYSMGPWDYPACATRHLKAWSTRTTQE
jgi:hypothetical protein